jgi:PilZ domain-containing protein
VVIDISSRGALVEALRPLRPGSHLELQLETDTSTALVRARVVRCIVAALDANGVTYRAGLSFSESCDWLREANPHGENAVP